MKKICSKCGVEKAVSEFHKEKRGKYGVRADCKICNSERVKKRTEENRDEINKKRRKAYKENPEAQKKSKKRIKEWKIKNRDHVLEYKKEYELNASEEYKNRKREYANKYHNERYANDPLYRLRKTIAYNCWRVTDAVKQQKEMRSLEYLGCSLDEFKLHIESLWLEGMTWENHSMDGWHIDHIVPLDYFVKNSDDPWEANHYKNLQPLWAEDNFSKGNRID